MAAIGSTDQEGAERIMHRVALHRKRKRAEPLLPVALRLWGRPPCTWQIISKRGRGVEEHVRIRGGRQARRYTWRESDPPASHARVNVDASIVIAAVAAGAAFRNHAQIEAGTWMREIPRRAQHGHEAHGDGYARRQPGRCGQRQAVSLQRGQHPPRAVTALPCARPPLHTDPSSHREIAGCGCSALHCAPAGPTARRPWPPPANQRIFACVHSLHCRRSGAPCCRIPDDCELLERWLAHRKGGTVVHSSTSELRHTHTRPARRCSRRREQAHPHTRKLTLSESLTLSEWLTSHVPLMCAGGHPQGPPAMPAAAGRWTAQQPSGKGGRQSRHRAKSLLNVSRNTG